MRVLMRNSIGFQKYLEKSRKCKVNFLSEVLGIVFPILTLSFLKSAKKDEHRSKNTMMKL